MKIKIQSPPCVFASLRLCVISLLLLFPGCAHYQSKFVVAGNSFTLPKDAQFSYLTIRIPTSNGPISLIVSNGQFKMNPAVIDSATAHDIGLINATAAAIGTIAGAALKP